MERVILGTAGHIDHGKTALVAALTGVDTDRLPEEQARGITIDLGFAELSGGSDVQVGVVDVPGHEDFVRTMVAGASGMDVVLLVVAADEGVMPQTREHLDIVRLLGVPALVVAVTKADLVEQDWLALVTEEVAELLAETPYAGAPVVATSVRDGRGLDTLRTTLDATASGVRHRRTDDLARLPVDRAFTIQGTGTVATGTLWSGTLSVGDRVRLLPSEREGRVRSLQVHGRDVTRAEAGSRTAVALAGVDRDAVARGDTLVAAAVWDATHMLTVRATVLPGARWSLEQGQRVRVHVGTAEVLARCALLDGSELPPGAEGWIQLRLEAPVVARAGDRIVLRSYSPLTTLGGAVVAEPAPPKRKSLDDADRARLSAVLEGTVEEAVAAVLALASWRGVDMGRLPLLAGHPPAAVGEALERLVAGGAVVAGERAFSARVAGEAGGRVLAAVDAGHQASPLEPAVSLAAVRAALPGWAGTGLADAVVARLQAAGGVELVHGGVRRSGFHPVPTPDQEAACARLLEVYREADLAPPFLSDLPAELRGREDLDSLLRYLEGQGALSTVDDGLLFAVETLRRAEAAVASKLAGRSDLGPADFRDVLPVSRRHLMPLLAYLDGLGITVRRGPVRDVPAR